MSSVRDIRFDDDEPASFQNDAFDEFFELYLSKLETYSFDDIKQRCLQAILGSADSAAALAILRNANLFRLANVRVSVVFGRLSSMDSLAQWFDASTNFKITAPANHFRWVKNQSLLDAHEQIVLGTTMCWSGDAMKRRPSQREGFELFEDSSPAMARLGRLAFEAMWDASAEISPGKLKIIDKVLSGRDVPEAEFTSMMVSDLSSVKGRICH